MFDNIYIDFIHKKVFVFCDKKMTRLRTVLSLDYYRKLTGDDENE